MGNKGERWIERVVRLVCGWRSPVGYRIRDVGFYLILFVFFFCLLSLVLGVVIPLSVTANRWLVAVLALGCLLSRI